jgi:autotransporter passenger strand-loop-strand repeat protein
MISSDGKEIVSSGGVASGTVIIGGGTAFVSSGGVASGTMISSDGKEIVSSGGVASGTVIIGGGTEIVSSGGVASGTVISSGGEQIVSSGGVASGTVISSGGTEIIASGGLGDGVRVLLGGTIDLAALPYAAGDTASVNGSDQLVVYNSGHTAIASVQLSGNFAGYGFRVTSDGSGGTDILERLAPVSHITGTYAAGIALTNPIYTNPVTVTATGSISGSGLYAATQWTVANYGHVSAGSSHYGVHLKSGGAVSNAAYATISALNFVAVYFGGAGSVTNAGAIKSNNIGVALDGGAGSLTNLAGGTISGNNIGVVIEGGGSVTNLAGGTISGGEGVYTGFGAGTLFNAGTISAPGGTAVFLYGTGANRLIVDAGAVFDGYVRANGGTNTIELMSSAAAGTLAGLGSEYVGFQTVTIDSGAAWTISGTQAGFAGVAVSGFNRYDTLDLTDLAFAAGDTALVNGSDQLVIYDSGNDVLGSIQLSGDFSHYRFTVTGDGASGIDITGKGTLSRIIGTYTSGITLTSADYTNPVTLPVEVTVTGLV